jgi:hypothetical protein
MSDEQKDAPADDAPADQAPATGEAAGAPEEQDAPDAAARTERVDEDGLPLDRAATIDDVRSQTGLHGRIGLGCAVLIVLFIVAFWLIRAGALG